MENKSFRKSLAVAVVILFLGVSVIPNVIGDNPSFGTTIYVDDDNTEGPWDGTENHPYQHIQDAIDNASKGDTVFVYSGIYYEHIVINTSISLVGEYREIPIIDGNNTGDVLVINANAHNTTIRDFTIQNCANQFYKFGTVVKIFSNNNTILNNDINNIMGNVDRFFYGPTGIQLFNSSYNIISDNIISINEYGIRIDSSDYNKITHNTVIGGHYGVFNDPAVQAKHSKNNIISNNLYVDNSQSGIHFRWGEYNEISNNTISNSNIGIASKMYNNIINNTISSCDAAGINIGTGNNVIGNTIDSVIDMGIWVEGSRNNITGNKIDSCELMGGIFFFSDNNTAKRNTISNCLSGIVIADSLGNKIIENNIRGNNEIGGSFVSPIKNRIWKKYVGGKYEPNYWNANYWGRPYISRKIIFGIKLLYLFPPIYINTVTGYIPILIPIPIPGIAYDNNPSREPYDIP